MQWLIGYGIWTIFKIIIGYIGEDYKFNCHFAFIPIVGEIVLLMIFSEEHNFKKSFIKTIRIMLPFLLLIPKCKMGLHEYESVYNSKAPEIDSICSVCGKIKFNEKKKKSNIVQETLNNYLEQKEILKELN